MYLHYPENLPDDIDEHTITILGGCSGSGMLEVAAEAAFAELGYRARTVCRIEREAETAAVGVALAQAAGSESPVHSDLATFDGRPWRGLVDVCVAGLPCPAFSTAGKRTGNSDERAWGDHFDPDNCDTWGPQPHWLRILAEVRPALVIFENVPAWVAAGHFRIVGDCLSGLGYTVQDPIFVTADSVGGSHQRERVFVLASSGEFASRSWRAESAGQQRGNATDQRGGELADSGEPRRERAERRGTSPESGTSARRPAAERGTEMGDGKRLRARPGDGRQQGDSPEHGGDRPAYAGQPMADGLRDGCGTAGHGQQRATERASNRLPLHCPGRNDWTAWAAVADARPDLLPALCNTGRDGLELAIRRGLRSVVKGRNRSERRRNAKILAKSFAGSDDAATAEPLFPVVADGLAEPGDAPVSNASLLRIGGNGVDSLAAATAIATLLRDAGKGR